jgi:hypothetical protein
LLAWFGTTLILMPWKLTTEQIGFLSPIKALLLKQKFLLLPVVALEVERQQIQTLLAAAVLVDCSTKRVGLWQLIQVTPSQ